MNALNVIILAAGKGTRMYSDIPKVLHSIAGRPMLAHVLQTAATLTSTPPVVVYGHGGDQVQAKFTNTNVSWVLQTPQLGTGHAVQLALPVLSQAQATLILYGDVPLIGQAALERLIGLCSASRMGLMTQFLKNPTGYGRIVRNQMGQVQKIVEEKDANSEQKAIQEVNAGLMCVPTDALRGWVNALSNHNAQGEYYVTDIVGMAAESGVEVATCQPDEDWEVLGVNSRLQQAELERIYQQQQAKRLLSSGVTLADLARIDIRGDLQCGRDVFIDVGCVFEGVVRLADGVRIGPYCVIRESEIGAFSEVHAFTHIDQAVVGAAAQVGPYARLRPGADLGDQVHVGNFVEIKNSRLAASTKANHLSYIGDADVGQRVNIGAGTITCNYDGANKYRTTIGNDVFIGSATQLVAPVTVGDNATIGAGTTLVKDAPPAQLTLSREKQKTILGWVRPVKKT